MIYLASQSPRRRELLEQIHIPHQVVKVDIDETPLARESPAEYVVRLAIEKARHAHRPDMTKPLLAADTTVTCDEHILGKPTNKAHFLEMMSLLSNRTHQVLTAIAVTGNNNEAVSEPVVKTRLSVSEVRFRKVGETEALAYWDNGEPRDKAGGYGIQGLGAIFIEEIRGSYSGIMGLPLYETAELLAEFGVYCFK